MSVPEYYRTLACTIVAACGTACATNPAPPGWLAPPDEAQQDPYGAWIEIYHGSGAGRRERARVGGELIAVGADTVFVLAEDGTFTTIPKQAITRARLGYYSSGSGTLILWTTMGTLSTISNGYFLAFTMPLWIVAGSLTTGAQTRAPIKTMDRERTRWILLTQYARFPLGLPEGVDRNTLLPKLPLRNRRR